MTVNPGVQVVFVFFCPACDTKYESSISPADVEEIVKQHVVKAHPLYDPEWYKTYPDS